MKKVKSWVFGLVRRETEIFFSKTIDHIEFYVSWKVFGKTIKEESTEVYIPALKILEKAKLKVIADVFIELHELGKKVKEEIGLDEN